MSGEVVILGVGGLSDFDALDSGRQRGSPVVCVDVLVMDGHDLRQLPLSMRKANLERLLARRPEGIPFERGELGPDLFRAACRMGLKGLVSKDRDR